MDSAEIPLRDNGNRPAGAVEEADRGKETTVTEPTVPEVLEEVRRSCRSRAETMADTQRNIETSLRLFTVDVRLLLRDRDSRVVGFESKRDLSLAQIRHELHDVRELLGLAHTRGAL